MPIVADMLGAGATARSVDPVELEGGTASEAHGYAQVVVDLDGGRLRGEHARTISEVSKWLLCLNFEREVLPEDFETSADPRQL